MPISERKRPKFTGRGKTPPFQRLPQELLDSEQFAHLTPKATKMLLDVCRQYRGRNNGDLSAPWSMLRHRGWISKQTAHSALQELTDAQFLRITRNGARNRCTLYAITWEAVDDIKGKGLEVGPEHAPSHAWRKNASPAPTIGATCPDHRGKQAQRRAA